MKKWIVYKGCRRSQTPFCARQVVGSDPTGLEVVGDDLEEIHQKLPPGAKRTMQSVLTDPLIVEIWTQLDS